MIRALLAIYWLVGTCAAAFSRCSVLRALSAHGKTAAAYSSGVTFEALLSSPYLWIVKVSEKIGESRGFTSLLSKSLFWVRKRHFVHFYIIGIFGSFVGGTLCAQFSKPFILFVLFLVHCLRRLVEQRTLFAPANETADNQSLMHILAYLLGVSYYVAVPLSLYLDCGSNEWRLGVLTSVFMISIFIALMIAQNLCHLNLSRLKYEEKNSHGLPRGGLYEWVVCPHYLIEVLIYLLFWTMASSSTSLSLQFNFMGACFCFTIISLTMNALNNWNWYALRYGNLVVWRNRKAIFPCIL